MFDSLPQPGRGRKGKEREGKEKGRMPRHVVYLADEGVDV